MTSLVAPGGTKRHQAAHQAASSGSTRGGAAGLYFWDHKDDLSAHARPMLPVSELSWIGRSLSESLPCPPSRGLRIRAATSCGDASGQRPCSHAAKGRARPYPSSGITPPESDRPGSGLCLRWHWTGLCLCPWTYPCPSTYPRHWSGAPGTCRGAARKKDNANNWRHASWSPNAYGGRCG